MQQRLFEVIKGRYKSKDRLVGDLMDLLKLERSAIYKRLKGTVLLNAEEIEILFQHFEIDPSLIFSKKKGRVTFDFPAMAKPIRNLDQFLAPIIEDLQEVALQKEAKIFFLATGFPIFYFFFYPEIAHFKFYIFQNSVWNKAKAALKIFNLDSIHNDKKRKADFEKIKKLYAAIDSEEIWTDNIFQTTVEEIEAYLDAGLFGNPNDALLLLDRLLELLEQIIEMVQTGHKSTMVEESTKKQGKLKVYYNRGKRFGSTILVSAHNLESVYLVYDLPNFLKSEDEDFAAYTKKRIRKVKRKSQVISSTSDMEQLKFFDEIRIYLLHNKQAFKKRYCRVAQSAASAR